MNANQLADWIETSAYGEYDSAKQAATMLRQQQDKLTKYELRHAEQRKRIDELEKDLYMLQRHYDQLGDMK